MLTETEAKEKWCPLVRYLATFRSDEGKLEAAGCFNRGAPIADCKSRVASRLNAWLGARSIKSASAPMERSATAIWTGARAGLTGGTAAHSGIQNDRHPFPHASFLRLLWPHYARAKRVRIARTCIEKLLQRRTACRSNADRSQRAHAFFRGSSRRYERRIRTRPQCNPRFVGAGMIERWLPIVGYEGLYEVSSEGRVKAIRRSGSPGRILIFRPDAAGYMKLNLYKIGSAKRKCIHRLVLEAFVGPCPEGMEGCHDDGDPGNNRSGNLRWDTPANNNDDKHRHGTILLGERNYATKITVSTVHDIFGLRQLGLSFQKIGNRVGLSRQHVRAILLRQCWKHVDVLSPAAIMRTSK